MLTSAVLLLSLLVQGTQITSSGVRRGGALQETHPVSLLSVGQTSAGNLMIGCFKDCGSSPDPSRDLPYWAYTDFVGNTPAKCVAYCALKNYTFAGVQYGSQCWCGNSWGNVGGTWYTVNSGRTAVRGGNWNDRLSDDYTVNDPTLCANRCKANPNCRSAMLQLNGPGCVLFPYTCDQASSSCPSWASYSWVGYWQKGGNPASPPQCTMACSGDSSQTCGNGCVSQVYATSYSQTLTHLGCFADSATRDLPVVAMGDENTVMTPQLCAYLCRPKYQFAGLQFGYQCFCGNRYGSQGTSSYCSMPCTGDSSVMCGNGYTNNVYRLY